MILVDVTQASNERLGSIFAACGEFLIECREPHAMTFSGQPVSIAGEGDERVVTFALADASLFEVPLTAITRVEVLT